MSRQRSILEYFQTPSTGDVDKSRTPHRRPPIRFKTLDDFQFPMSLDVSQAKSEVHAGLASLAKSEVHAGLAGLAGHAKSEVHAGLAGLAKSEVHAGLAGHAKSEETPRILCYTDGSCLHNGTNHAKGAYAVYFPNGEFHNIAERFINKPTNQRCELMAILKALRAFADGETTGARKMTLYTDSEYSLKCITQYCKKWSHNGWLKADHKPIENRDIIQPLYELYSKPHVWKNVELRHIRSHTGLRDIHSQCNEEVDRMAKRAIG